MNYTCKPFEGIYGEITDKSVGLKHVLYEFNPGNFLYPSPYKNFAQKVLNTRVRTDDTWLVSYPRTGSTWCQEMVWLIGNNLDFDTAQSTIQQFRAPLIEASGVLFQFANVLKEKFDNSVDYVNSLPSPRFIKSHLPYPLLPSEIHIVKPKIIYTIRHPKDVCVSFYDHCQMLYGLKGIDFETFCELFLNDAVACGNIFKHYFEFWNRRHEKHMLILRYEDMKNDTRGTLKQIGDFMEKELLEGDLDALEDYLSFRRMRENRGVNITPLMDYVHGEDFCKKSGHYFIRKGEIGDWKNHMSPEMSKRFDEWIEKNTAGTDLHFN